MSQSGHRACSRVRRPMRSLVVGLLAAALLCGCQSDVGGHRRHDPTPTMLITAVPEFHGHRSVRLGSGIRAYFKPPCEPSHDRVCSADGQTSYVLAQGPVDATLTSVRMRLNPEHTAWTVVFTVADADLRPVGRAALSAGGLVLVLTPDGTVVEDLPPVEIPRPTVTAHRLRLFDLTKPEAWQTVAPYVDAAA